MPGGVDVSALLDAEEALARRWQLRFGEPGQLPVTARELLHSVITGVSREASWREAVAEPSYALGVLRAQQGRDATSLVEDLLALRPLVWGHVAALPQREGAFSELLLLQDRLTELLDLALRCAVDAFVGESTRVLSSRATRDPLTGLVNRSGFEEALQREIAGEAGAPTLLMMDLDGFKGVNDLRGHLAGDDVLVAVARILERVSKGRSVPVRLGGDEFAVVLPATDQPAGLKFAARLLATVRKDPRLADPTTPVRMSIGVGWLAAPHSCVQLIGMTDAALYRAKRAGGDRAEPTSPADLAPPVVAPPAVPEARRADDPDLPVRRRWR